MRAILGGGLAVALAVLAGHPAAAQDDKIDVKLLLGKWTPKDLPKDVKQTVEFFKDGKAVLDVTVKGKTEKLEGTYKIDGKKLSLTIKKGDKEETQTRTVVKLTDTELVAKDDKGTERTQLRVK